MAAPAVAAGGAALKTAGKKLLANEALKRLGGRRGNDDDKGKGFKCLSCCLAIPAALAGSGFILFVVIFGAAATILGILPSSACGTTTGSSAGGSPTSATQLANARTIIGVAKARNIPMQGWVVALATAFQESSIQNLANSSISASLSIPHEGVCDPASCGTSVGVFQQLANTGWGTVAQEMDVAHAAGKFFDALLGLPTWQNLPVTVAAQDVQGSAYPDAYAKWEGQARALASSNTDAPPITTSGKSFGGSSGGSSANSFTAVCGGTGGYINPFKTGSWGPARTDQGVDWIPMVDNPVLAIGNGHITYANNNDCGWPGSSTGACGGCVVYELDDGPLAHHYIYVCEHITVTVMSGKITAGQQIAIAHPGYAWTEWGWAAPPGSAAAPLTPYGVLADGTPTPGGEAFARFLASLGAHPRDLSVAPTGPLIVGH
jgi:murein DD-endopeptidase MepM/ murein hydrolase activator NlpD